jgi:hypothetical protein
MKTQTLNPEDPNFNETAKARYFAVLLSLLRKETNPQTPPLVPPMTTEEEAEVTENSIDKDRGGVKARRINFVKLEAPEIYREAWKHRASMWARLWQSGEAEKFRILSIPQKTTRAELLAALKLSNVPSHLELTPPWEGQPGLCAIVFVRRKDGAHLIDRNTVTIVKGEQVDVSPF